MGTGMNIDDIFLLL